MAPDRRAALTFFQRGPGQQFADVRPWLCLYGLWPALLAGSGSAPGVHFDVRNGIGRQRHRWTMAGCEICFWHAHFGGARCDRIQTTLHLLTVFSVLSTLNPAA